MKKTPIKRHVATKIFVLLLTGYVFLTMVLTSLYMVNQYNQIKERAFHNQQMLLNALAPSLGQVTFDGDLDQLESLLEGIIKSPIIVGIAYSDITQTLNVRFGDIPSKYISDSGNSAVKTELHKIGQFEIDSLFGLSGHIIHDNQIIGSIVIASSNNIIFTELKSAFFIIILSILIQGFLLWIFIRWVSTVYLHKRLSDITDGLNRLESDTGNFTPLKVDSREQDEIWAIQKSFNSMAKKLQNSHNKLKKANEKLEEKVQKRTAELERISITDRLTGLYNRHKLDSDLENELKRSKRYNNAFSLILIDIDHFKKINDTYGHQVGDKVLTEFAKLLIDSVRSIDVVGRWGGEEFLIIVPETQLDGALLLAQSIRLKIEKHVFEDIPSKTASFGVSSYKQGDSINDLISRADSALYNAKNKGRNTVEYLK